VAATGPQVMPCRPPLKLKKSHFQFYQETPPPPEKERSERRITNGYGLASPVNAQECVGNHQRAHCRISVVYGLPDPLPLVSGVFNNFFVTFYLAKLLDGFRGSPFLAARQFLALLLCGCDAAPHHSGGRGAPLPPARGPAGATCGLCVSLGQPFK
jgi:hypothetical protein